ncbi:MAG: hypothetical protein IPH04_18880, partial [Saprospirales bacterium]|nr:hypothetical protein [Saprospirales bacterium]
MENHGFSGKEYPSGLEAFYLGNWLADHSQFKDPHGIIANFTNKSKIKEFLKEQGISLLTVVKNGVILHLRDLAYKKNKGKPYE